MGGSLRGVRTPVSNTYSSAGFQLYYPMREKEVRGSTGVDLVEAMLAVFEEVTPLMNLCQQVRIYSSRPSPRAPI